MIIFQVFGRPVVGRVRYQGCGGRAAHIHCPRLVPSLRTIQKDPAAVSAIAV